MRSFDCLECAVWARVQGFEAGRYGLDAGDRRCEHLRFAGETHLFGQRTIRFGDIEAPTHLTRVQFAKAAGARVIATTSSDSKGETLRELGADLVLNYKTDPSWGENAKKASTRGLGVDHILEVGGPTSMAQSLKAIKPEGVISIIGFLGGMSKDQPGFLECLNTLATVRGVMVGSRLQFQAMNEAIDSCGIKPVVDEKVFALEELKDAYQYMVSSFSFPYPFTFVV